MSEDRGTTRQGGFFSRMFGEQENEGTSIYSAEDIGAEESESGGSVAHSRAFTVEKSLVNWYITHLAELNRLGWSSKHEGPDGKSVGMRIGGVTCGNDLHLAGIRSGDVVHRVNGHDVRSLTQAIFVYRKVRNDRRIRVELTRRGKPVTLTYRLLS